MIKVVSFDIGGTLLENSHDNTYSLKSLAELVSKPYESVRDVYKKVFQKRKGTLEELIEMFCNELEISNSNELKKFFIDKFSNKGCNHISNDKVTLIKEIKRNGYKVILFSNSCSLINNDAIKDIYDLVDGVFYSFDMGYTKDDKESYRYIEEKLDVKSSEILHVGDTLNSDYLKPRENGWDALFYGKTEVENIKCISSLIELYDILDLK